MLAQVGSGLPVYGSSSTGWTAIPAPPDRARKLAKNLELFTTGVSARFGRAASFVVITIDIVSSMSAGHRYQATIFQDFFLGPAA